MSISHRQELAAARLGSAAGVLPAAGDGCTAAAAVCAACRLCRHGGTPVQPPDRAAAVKDGAIGLACHRLPVRRPPPLGTGPLA
jgi:hypothetical protein